ncbi:MAG: SusD/RagB family nutrient-binding outer membrane lipoprotein [Cytophagales bacterium]|nr:SusD/RagB family nutrient-binding outer membrane lipoprotein [Cytophagales bacterium]
MKTKKINIIALTLSTLLIMLTGCELEKVNINPDAAVTAPNSSLLTSAQANLAFSIGVHSILTNTYIQHFSGANGDAAPNDSYKINATYFNAVWNSVYTNSLAELDIIKKQGVDQNSPYYVGIAKILTAYAYGELTDQFGDIPRSEALKGAEIKTPKFDTQESVYAFINQELDDAIVELSKPASTFKGVPPSSDDVIYRGNAANWIAAAYTLKARYALHTSKFNAATAASKAIDALYSGSTFRAIANNANDLQLNFGASVTNSNPYFQQQTFRPNWVGLGRSFVNLLNGNSVTDAPTKAETAPVDPRRAAFATQNPTASGRYRGAIAGIPGAFSLIGPFYATNTSPVIFTSFVEAKFIEAEARLILGEQAAAQAALTAAVTASFNKVITGAAAADTNATPAKRTKYLATKATLTGNNFDKDLETIITQKYIALFTNAEVFVDYRRTGHPALVPAVGGTSALNPNGLIPRRLPYPASEQINNPNTPIANYQTPRLWWDGN